MGQDYDFPSGPSFLSEIAKLSMLIVGNVWTRVHVSCTSEPESDGTLLWLPFAVPGALKGASLSILDVNVVLATLFKLL